MAKITPPLPGIEIHGTLGEALTFQVNKGIQIARKKPMPTQPQTWPQIYHRWDYQDYAHLWTTLSQAEKDAYKAAAWRKSYMPFNAFMSEQLSELPDLSGRWPLCDSLGPIGLDTSKNQNNATIFGATTVPGLINTALNLDGLDDHLNCGHDPVLDFTGLWSIILWLTLTRKWATHGLLYKRQWQKLTTRIGDNKVLYNDLWFQDGTTIPANVVDYITWGDPTMLTLTYDYLDAGQEFKVYRNVELVGSFNTAGKALAAQADRDLIISYAVNGFKGLLDSAILYNRPIALSEIAHHYERKF